MTGAARHLSYSHDGRDEYVLSHGPADAARRILFIPPLFDEMNRTRAMLVGAMRELAARDVMTALPDLPGCNESLAPIEMQSLFNWQSAVMACAKAHAITHVAAIRGGALLDSVVAAPRWRLAPAKGGPLLKTLLRTRIAADKEAGLSGTAEDLIHEASANGTVELAGYRLGLSMLEQLDAAWPNEAVEAKTMQAGTNEGDLWGKPIWLRAEPQEDADMSAALAAELDDWSRA